MLNVPMYQKQWPNVTKYKYRTDLQFLQFGGISTLHMFFNVLLLINFSYWQLSQITWCIIRPEAVHLYIH